MAYTINKFDGSILTSLQDGTIDRNTDLKLVGKNFAGYGEIQNENFVFLLENFANSSPPSRPIRGQLWYNSADEKIKVFDNGEFKSLTVTEISDTQPNNLQNGEFWWDSESNQLFGYTGTNFELIGPEKAGTGITRLVSTNVIDSESNEQPIIQALIEDDTVFVISDSEFDLSAGSFIDGFSIIKKGVTLKNSAIGVTDPNDYWFWGSASNSNKLDNLDSTQFLRSDQTTTLSGNLVFADNQTGLSFSTSAIKEKNNNLNVSVEESNINFVESIADVTTLKINTTDSTNGLSYFDNTVWHEGNQGPESGLDADTVDGLQASDFLGATEKAVDADKLDGLDSSAFLERTGGTMTGQINLPGNPTDDEHAVNKGYLDEQLELVGQPGQVAYFAMQSAPDGWLKANGALLDRATYTRLFNAIGTQFGTTDSTNFRVPDLRGEFVRGWDDGRGIDAGRDLGSTQSGEIQSHDHSMSTSGGHSHSATASNAGSHSHTGSTNTAGRHSHTLFGNNRGSFSSQESAPGLFVDDAERAADDNNTIQPAGDHSHSLHINSAGNHSHTINVDSAGEHSHNIFATGGAETRPRNFALLACIRY